MGRQKKQQHKKNKLLFLSPHTYNTNLSAREWPTAFMVQKSWNETNTRAGRFPRIDLVARTRKIIIFVAGTMSTTFRYRDKFCNHYNPPHTPHYVPLLPPTQKTLQVAHQETREKSETKKRKVSEMSTNITDASKKTVTFSSTLTKKKDIPFMWMTFPSHTSKEKRQNDSADEWAKPPPLPPPPTPI